MLCLKYLLRVGAFKKDTIGVSRRFVFLLFTGPPNLKLCSSFLTNKWPPFIISLETVCVDDTNEKEDSWFVNAIPE
jgi:hypothetical protein